ncbi:MAG: arylamine N-acetyltransferase [Pyrinomonadaceae bacterium]
MKKNSYLQRIGLSANDLLPGFEGLKRLQRQHLLHIPFENLDIHWKRPISLDFVRFYRKIVEMGRGGFCYELNGLFYGLLKDLGYRCRIISARVHTGNGDFGPEYDHLALLVETGGEEYLTDVGFGDFAAEPLRFIVDVEQKDRNGTFLIEKFEDDYFQVAKKDKDAWKIEYIFKNEERDLVEFAGMCEFHQTSPDSHFTRGRVCSLMTESGRKTLTDHRFIETDNGEKKETAVGSERTFEKMLWREFKITGGDKSG